MCCVDGSECTPLPALTPPPSSPADLSLDCVLYCTTLVLSSKRSVCVWDLLLPNAKALVTAPVCHTAGAASVAFSASHQLLISGGEGGSISVFDVRQRRVLHTVSNAHETAITTLELHPSGHCVLSGSASGDVKIWSLPIFREVTSLSKVHAKPSFLGDAASNLLGDAASNMAINVVRVLLCCWFGCVRQCRVCGEGAFILTLSLVSRRLWRL